MRTIEKIVGLFCIIVVVTFFINHGEISFAGVDWVKDRATEAISSEEGQEYIQETKEISKGVFHDLFYGVKELITGEGDPDEEAAKSSLEEATLLSCIDGDTIKVKIDGKEETIRLIGINTPESVNPDESLNSEYGTIASDYTKTLLENVNTLYLEYDVSTEDTYGRTLAYVWISKEPKEPESNMINAILVKNGYADDVVYLPNNKYADVFMNLQKEAQANETGLWKYEEISQDWGNS